MPVIQDYINGRWKPREIDDSMPTMTPDEIVKTLRDSLEEYSIEKYPAKHRSHLGISLIGDECWRKIWLTFRWAKLNQFDPRMRRLFQRGKDEEAKIEQFLLWAGISFRAVIDPSTGDQHKASLIDGHYGGETDGIATLGFADNLPVICEFKTHNKKSFDKWKADGVVKSKPEHWAQMCGYGKEFKIQHGLYVAVNKDDETMDFEFKTLDWNYAIELEKKATDIIYAKLPPEKISQQSSFWKCQYCHFQSICFYNEPVEKNCRSCVFSEPVENAQWKCNKFGQVIPKDFIPKGCNEHKGII